MSAGEHCISCGGGTDGVHTYCATCNASVGVEAWVAALTLAYNIAAQESAAWIQDAASTIHYAIFGEPKETEPYVLVPKSDLDPVIASVIGNTSGTTYQRAMRLRALSDATNTPTGDKGKR